MSTFRRPRLTSSCCPPAFPSIACQFAGGRKGRRVGWKRPKVRERIYLCAERWHCRQTFVIFEFFVSHLNVFSCTFSNTCTYGNYSHSTQDRFSTCPKSCVGPQHLFHLTPHRSLPTCFACVGRVCSMCPGEERGKVRGKYVLPFSATGLTCTLSRRGKRKISFGDYMRGRKLCDLDCANYVLLPDSGFFFRPVISRLRREEEKQLKDEFFLEILREIACGAPIFLKIAILPWRPYGCYDGGVFFKRPLSPAEFKLGWETDVRYCVPLRRREIAWGVLFRRGRFAYAEYSEYSFPSSLEGKSNRQWE